MGRSQDQILMAQPPVARSWRECTCPCSLGGRDGVTVSLPIKATLINCKQRCNLSSRSQRWVGWLYVSQRNHVLAFIHPQGWNLANDQIGRQKKSVFLIWIWKNYPVMFSVTEPKNLWSVSTCYKWRLKLNAVNYQTTPVFHNVLWRSQNNAGFHPVP